MIIHFKLQTALAPEAVLTALTDFDVTSTRKIGSEPPGSWVTPV